MALATAGSRWLVLKLLHRLPQMSNVALPCQLATLYGV